MTDLSLDISQEEKEAWAKESLANATKYLAQQGISPMQFFDEDEKVIAPLCAVWKILASNGKKYWVIAGRLPTDFAAVNAATNTRDVLRYFSFQWQLKADQLSERNPNNPTSQEFANYLVNRAHGLYELFEEDSLWDK